MADTEVVGAGLTRRGSLGSQNSSGGVQTPTSALLPSLGVSAKVLSPRPFPSLGLAPLGARTPFHSPPLAAPAYC